MKDANKISFFAAVLMSMNIMIGAGILVAVGPMTSIAGTISFLAWPLTGLLLFPVILGLAKASQMFSGEGGFYNYCTKGIGPVAGIIAQWIFILGYLGTAASLFTVLRNGIAESSGSQFLVDYPFLFNILVVSFYTLINLIPVSKISKIQSIGTLLKLTPIVTVIAVMAFYYNPNLQFNLSSMSNISMTFSTVIFAYLGFEACCSISGLLKDGPQKIGKVILTAFFITMALYSFFHVGLLFIMGADNLAKYGAIGFPQFLGLSPMVGTAMQVGISFAILFSWANSILGLSLANVSNVYTLASNKLVLGDKFLTKLNQYQRPTYIALGHGAILFMYVSLIREVDVLFALTNLCVGVSLTLTMVAVFLTLLKQKSYFQLTLPLLSFGSCAMWLYYSWVKIPNAFYIVPIIGALVAAVVMFKIQKYRQTKKSIA